MKKTLLRRDFLRATAIAGGGMLVACKWDSDSSSRPTPASSARRNDETPAADPNAERWTPNAFIRISADNFVTVIVGAAEIGQGTMTAVPMIVAEELDADWERVSWEQSEASAITYGNPFWQSEGGLGDLDQAGLQITAASTTVRGYYDSQRRAGAAVRQMLLEAASDQLNVPVESLTTRNSFVIHTASRSRLSYGSLAAAAAEKLPPLSPPLKDPSEFRLIGQRKQRLDAAEKSDGSLDYGFDFKIPNMVTVMVIRAPRFGAQLIGHKVGDAVDVDGFRGVHPIPSGLAVVADDYWSAEQARKLITTEWIGGEELSTADLKDQFDTRNSLPGVPVRNDALRLPGLPSGDITEDYHFPYLAHAPMEPLNVTIDYRGSECEIWCGSQWPDMDQLVAATVLGLPPAAVKFNNLLSGGGFGRRACLGFDYIQEAAHVARVVGQPLKVVWTREDDIRGGYYRPYTACRLSASLDGAGGIASWSHRVASQTLLVNPIVETALGQVTEEVQTSQGAKEMPYAIPDVYVDTHAISNGVPTLWVRSVANATNVYAVETFFDHLAKQAGRHPLSLRRELLQEKPRHLAVLNAVAEMANWTPETNDSLFRGVAVFASYESVIAQLIEADVEKQGEGKHKVSIRKVYSAVDCGTAVNPDLVEAQIESGIVFALSSILFGEIELENGEVKQSNFHDYPVLRMYQSPAMETRVLPSDHSPGGVGELGVPCVGPALANAIYAATETLYTSLPLNRHASLVFE
ncbi:isoquinoline 1-oxidoreductase beta subunit [Litorivivens lipolytica]|uniref:Isoquinoline 1-oxidoreductase beta subunit n=1 Tax=Litorivivens lipolytica TaxID=1524264 RepID=A0A7W4Z4F3_9GAMM|nr:molybdopterin cofactor-binding domain-containing protein [Litorivivens lipolytica]MBB3046053.1 isoquinoline 1-oxidoreductase beta subunit [Litorivivens lipolytica]